MVAVDRPGDEEHFGRYWDAVVRGAPPEELALLAEPLDPGIVALVAQWRALGQRPRPQPAFTHHLERDLMHAFALSHPSVHPPAPSPNGLLPARGSVPLPPPPSPRARPWGQWPGPLAQAGLALLLIAALLAGYFAISRHQQPRPAVSPAVATQVTDDAASGDWPMFRGSPARNGIMPGPGMISGPTIVWQLDVVAALTAGAPIVDGVLYVVADDGALYAVDTASGAVRWQTPASFATPAVSGGVLYYAAPDGALVARELASGQDLWRASPVSRVWSLLATNGVVYHGGDANLLVARDARTGAEQWVSQQTTQASGAAALADGVIVIGSEDHTLYALDQTTGTTKWRVPLGDGASVIGTPAIDGGAVFVGTSGGGQNVFVALDLQTGSERWRLEGEHGENFETPGADDGRVFVTSSAGTLRGLDAETGEVIWNRATSGGVQSGPAIVRGVLYVGGRDGVLRSLAVNSGADYGTLPLHEPISFGQEVVGGRLYVGTADGVIYAIGDESRPPHTPTPAAPSP